MLKQHQSLLPSSFYSANNNVANHQQDRNQSSTVNAALRDAKQRAAAIASKVNYTSAPPPSQRDGGGYNSMPPLIQGALSHQEQPYRQQQEPTRRFNQPDESERGRSRKRKKRWGDEGSKTVIPGMPTTMPKGLNPEQEKAYITQLRIEDITRKLRTGELDIPENPDDRSPSPQPIYNGEGKRMNTREYRTRKKMEEERHKLVTEMTSFNSDYQPPAGYRPMQQRVSERVSIPAEDHPGINFVGLLIGPRGNTLKKLEQDNDCKIMIRGKGSVKEGKIVRDDLNPIPAADEPLHALVSASCLENVKKAVAEIEKIIKQGIEQPEHDNHLRKMQLMELAQLNGTLREDMVPRERAWLRPENQNVTNTTVCGKCGGRGHLEQDCRSDAGHQQGAAMPGVDRAKMDSEYLSLMEELGEKTVPGPNSGSSSNNDKPRNNNNFGGNNSVGNNRGGPPMGGNFGNNGGGHHNNHRGGGPPRPPRMSGGENFNRGFGGPHHRPPMMRGGYHGGPPRPGFHGSRGPPPGAFQNRPPMMNHGGPPQPWYPPGNGPYGGGPPNHQMSGHGAPHGYVSYPMGGGNNPSMFGGGNFNHQQQQQQYMNQPPPPPSVPQPPPPPSGDGGYPSAGGMWGQQPPMPPPSPSSASNYAPVPPPPPSDQQDGYGMGGYNTAPPPPPPPPQ